MVKSWISPKAMKKIKSNINGFGLFATRDISKGELVAVKAGEIITKEVLYELDDEIRKYNLQIAENLFISATRIEDVDDTALYLNHSCNPNLGMRGDVSFIAIRDIKSGEEIVVDYAFFDAEGYNVKNCNCGFENCRKSITGNDYKMKDIQMKQGKYFSSYIKELVNKK